MGARVYGRAAVIGLDHVILGVADLDVAAEALGLPSLAGGHHEGRGTGNRIVALGPSYLELMAVVDADEAAGHPFGRWVAASLAGGDRFLGWCVRTDDLDAVSARLRLTPEAWSRARPDGAVLRWRLAGLETSHADPSLPFFIQWELTEEELPGYAGPRAGAIERVEVGGDPERVAEWVGAEVPEVVVVGSGPAGPQRVEVRAGVRVVTVAAGGS